MLAGGKGTGGVDVEEEGQFKEDGRDINTVVETDLVPDTVPVPNDLQGAELARLRAWGIDGLTPYQPPDEDNGERTPDPPALFEFVDFDDAASVHSGISNAPFSRDVTAEPYSGLPAVYGPSEDGEDEDEDMQKTIEQSFDDSKNGYMNKGAENSESPIVFHSTSGKGGTGGGKMAGKTPATTAMRKKTPVKKRQYKKKKALEGLAEGLGTGGSAGPQRPTNKKTAEPVQGDERTAIMKQNLEKFEGVVNEQMMHPVYTFNKRKMHEETTEALQNLVEYANKRQKIFEAAGYTTITGNEPQSTKLPPMGLMAPPQVNTPTTQQGRFYNGHAAHMQQPSAHTTSSFNHPSQAGGEFEINPQNPTSARYNAPTRYNPPLDTYSTSYYGTMPGSQVLGSNMRPNGFAGGSSPYGHGGNSSANEFLSSHREQFRAQAQAMILQQQQQQEMQMQNGYPTPAVPNPQNYNGGQMSQNNSRTQVPQNNSGGGGKVNVSSVHDVNHLLRAARGGKFGTSKGGKVDPRITLLTKDNGSGGGAGAGQQGKLE
ncbi:hypothetical protein CC80DRAFT_493902 [Byssothecium circinans]|uniref:Uncharacterized protein n=1 Tax=Byssothecium circinans TaxID=147558 RepID=A0A6A5TP86_9PLEO|nr:hypothetical protein CC80DRAFT_493902 [Byssothecium circinans]